MPSKKKYAEGEKTNEEIKESVGRIKFRTDFDIIQERERERVRWGQFCQLQRQRLARQIGMAIVPSNS